MVLTKNQIELLKLNWLKWEIIIVTNHNWVTCYGPRIHWYIVMFSSYQFICLCVVMHFWYLLKVHYYLFVCAPVCIHVCFTISQGNHYDSHLSILPENKNPPDKHNGRWSKDPIQFQSVTGFLTLYESFSCLLIPVTGQASMCFTISSGGVHIKCHPYPIQFNLLLFVLHYMGSYSGSCSEMHNIAMVWRGV